MGHMEEIKDYWNLRANGFSLAVEEELKTEVGVRWKKIFQEYIKKEHANVLDDGTGAGFFPVILSSLGHCVTAIDYSDEMVEQAFDDQCTGANPRYPLMKEIKQMYLRAYYGAEANK